MDRALKLAVVLAAVLALLAVVASVLPRLVFNPGGSGYEPVFEVVEERYPLLATLNYTLIGAREHAQWIWSTLSEHSQDDPAIAPYLEWLRRVLSEPFQAKPFRLGSYTVLDAASGGFPRLPAYGSKVRMGYLRLPFGYGLIVTAYQDEQGLLNVVIHGTVLNESDYRVLAARVAGYAHLTVLTWNSAPGVMGTCEDVFQPKDWVCVDKPTTYWYLWRVPIRGAGYLEVNETTKVRIRDVYVLLEMPNIGIDVPFELAREMTLFSRMEVERELWERVRMLRLYDSRPLEHANWVMFHAAFGLASNFAHIDPGSLALSIAFTGTEYNWAWSETPLEVRMAGGYVCQGTATATAILVSSLGAPSIYPVVYTPHLMFSSHAVGTIVRLSSLGEQGRVRMSGWRGTSIPLGEGADVDMDGVPDSFDVLIDTAYLGDEYIERNLDGIDTICPPLVCLVYDPPNKGFTGNLAMHLLLLYTGAPQAVLGLPEWLKTPALLRYQWLTERWIEELLTNYTYYDILAEELVFIVPIIYLNVSYTEVVEGSLAEKVALWLHVADKRIETAYALLSAERAALRRFDERGAGPEFFVPPSASAFRGALGSIALVYSNATIPPVPKEYAIRYGEHVMDKEGIREALMSRLQQLVQPSPEPESPKPVEVEVVLEPVYVEVPFYLNETEFIVARAFDRWEGRVVVEGNEYTVRLYLSQSYGRPGEYIYVLEVEKQVDWWHTMTWHAYYTELPGNGTRAELDLDVGKVALTVYYKPAELPDIGLIEVSEDALTLYQEYKIMLDGELITARLYVINATTIRGAPALIAQRNGTVVVVFGTVGTLEAGVSVQVYGAPTRMRYTVTAELVLPNGTAIPLKLDWWSPNPPETGIIYVSTNTYDLPRMKLSGATLRITVQEINLTVVIRIPS